jgi:MFS family permease
MTSAPPRSQLGVLFLTVFVDLVGFSVIFPLFPKMLEHYLASEGSESLIGRLLQFLDSLSAAEDAEKRRFYSSVLFGGFLGSLYSVLQFLFAPMWGALSDRVGRRPVLLVTIAGLALSYLLWAFSGTFALLVASRLLGGVMSGNISVARAAIADSTGREGRAKGMAVVGMAFGLGFILGPALGAALSYVDLSKHIDLPGIQPFSAAAAGALALSLWNLSWVWRKLDETLPARAEASRAPAEGESAARPRNPLRILAGHEWAGVNPTHLAYFAFLVAFAGMEFTLTFLASERFGYQPRGMAGIFVFTGLILALVQGGVVRRLKGPAVKRGALAGLVLTVPGFLVTGFGSSEALLYVGLTFLAVGSALAMPCLTTLVSLYTPPEHQGRVQGTFASAGALARAVGPILGCLVYWKFGSTSPYLAGAVFLALPLALAASLPAVGGEEESRCG